MEDLTRFKCIPCRGTEPPLNKQQIEEFMKQTPEWQVLDVGGVPHLQRVYKVKDFARALEMTDLIGRLAEEEDHHPTITTAWGKVTVEWWTHKINGLHQNDFIMAAKSDQIFKNIPASPG